MNKTRPAFICRSIQPFGISAVRSLLAVAFSIRAAPVGRFCATNAAWVQATAALIAGHTYTLTLLSHDDNFGADPSFTLFDDVAIGAVGPPPPPPPSGITNGGFESGLAGWVATGPSVTAVNSGCHGGTSCARLGSTSPTNGDSNLAQTFTAPAGSTNLTFWYQMTCPDTVSYDWATVSLKDNTSGTTSTPLAKVCTNVHTLRVLQPGPHRPPSWMTPFASPSSPSSP